MAHEIAAARLRQFVSAFPGKRILVVGDLMLDEFIWGKVSRISPEAPVPVVNVVSESYYPGGAANVARNAREFHAAVAMIGLTGADHHGRQLLRLLEESGIDTAGVLEDADRTTAVKTRIVARNQQMVRIDRERNLEASSEQTRRTMDNIAARIESIDAVIVADYGKGFLTQPLADWLSLTVRRQGKILAVDPHPHTSLCWRGATVIKPNRAEAFLAAGLPPRDPGPRVCEDAPLLEAGRRLLQAWETESLIITLGEDGMLLLQADVEPFHTPARAKEVFDVSGAGDTAIAVLTLALSAGASPVEATELANIASGIAVGKVGTATVTPAELHAELSRPQV
jgi:D-beta-D-heptose 7-phosphate kinase/D-beta-D-heptose 1-phosphate adenosyltransferase